MIGLPHAEESMIILCLVVSIQYRSVTDRRTDGQTVEWMHRTATGISISHYAACQKAWDYLFQKIHNVYPQFCE